MEGAAEVAEAGRQSPPVEFGTARVGMGNEALSSFRFGWVEAFVVAADYPSYEAAALAAGLSATSLQRNVDCLEGWLGRYLFDDNRPLELSSPFGEQFLPMAREVLQILGDCRASASTSHVRSESLVECSPWSFIGIDHLRALTAIPRSKTIQQAAHAEGVDYGKFARWIRELESAFGGALICGAGPHVRLTEDGSALVNAAQTLITVLNECRFVMPEGTDVAGLRIYGMSVIVGKQIRILRESIAALSKAQRISKRTRAEMQGRQKSIALLESYKGELGARYGHLKELYDELASTSVRLI